MKILVINGPNLNLLGKREPKIYGHATLSEIMANLHDTGLSLGAKVDCFQANAEHLIVERIQAVLLSPEHSCDGVIINPAAFTHTSVAIRDALSAINKPIFEVHLSNVHARESFRHHSFISDIATGVIVGCGAMGYELALRALNNHLQNNQ